MAESVSLSNDNTKAKYKKDTYELLMLYGAVASAIKENPPDNASLLSKKDTKSRVSMPRPCIDTVWLCSSESDVEYAGMVSLRDAILSEMPLIRLGDWDRSSSAISNMVEAFRTSGVFAPVVGQRYAVIIESVVFGTSASPEDEPYWTEIPEYHMLTECLAKTGRIVLDTFDPNGDISYDVRDFHPPYRVSAPAPYLYACSDIKTRYYMLSDALSVFFSIKPNTSANPLPQETMDLLLSTLSCGRCELSFASSVRKLPSSAAAKMQIAYERIQFTEEPEDENLRALSRQIDMARDILRIWESALEDLHLSIDLRERATGSGSASSSSIADDAEMIARRIAEVIGIDAMIDLYLSGEVPLSDILV